MHYFVIFVALVNKYQSFSLVKRFFSTFFFLLNALVILCLIGAYISVSVSPASFWPLAFLGIAYPYILFANILFVLFWLFTKPLYALFSLVIILIGSNHSGNYFQFAKSKTEEKGLDVLSYNVHGFLGGSNGEIKQQVQQVASYLVEQKLDIICLQEANYMKRVYGDWAADFQSLKLPKHSAIKGGQAILSNFPIINSKRQDFEGTENGFMYADLLVEKDTIRVYNCHLQSYAFTRQDIGLLDSINVEDQSALLEDAKIYVAKLKRGFVRRAEQAEVLRQSIDDSPYAIIVCGDFNDTPVSYTYHTTLGSDLSDAFVNSGNGLGSTYHGRLPSFRIDYIFHSKQLESFNFETGDVDLSDHYPIKCRLKISDSH